MEEIVPAARLLSRATSEVPQDFEHSKQIFLHTVDRMKVVSEVCHCPCPLAPGGAQRKRHLRFTVQGTTSGAAFVQASIQCCRLHCAFFSSMRAFMPSEQAQCDCSCSICPDLCRLPSESGGVVMTGARAAAAGSGPACSAQPEHSHSELRGFCRRE